MGQNRPTIDDTHYGSTLHLPRILCLHGGGTNARIFRAQCRGLESRLRNRFRLCYAEAPFPSQAGPDVLSVYEKYGPFRRWLLSSPDDQEGEIKATLSTVEQSLAAAMYDDDCKGATGNWAGLLGFSQGAKLAASILITQQAEAGASKRKAFLPRFHFAVLIAGRAPISMDPTLCRIPRMADSPVGIIPGQMDRYNGEQTMDSPTIHVHGLRDPGLEFHRRWINKCCKEGSTRVIEWDGDHRLPIKTRDVSMVVDAITALGGEIGFLV